MSAATWPGESVDPHLVPHLDRSALLVIDTQVDFVDGGVSPVPGTTSVVPSLVRLRDAFVAAGRPVVHVVRLYAGDDVDLVRRTAVTEGRGPVAPGTPGAQVVPELRGHDGPAPDQERLLAGDVVEVAPYESVMWKPRWSAFHRTALARRLDEERVDTVVVAGCNFPNCPRATIVDASQHDLRVLVVADAVSGVQEHHLVELGLIGALHTDTETMVAAMS